MLIIGVIALISGCSSNKNIIELPKEDLLALAAEAVEMYNIPVAKNIGLMDLPSIRQLPFGGAGGGAAPDPIFPFSSLAECGTMCDHLLRAGYVDEIISQRDFQDRKADDSVDAWNAYRKFLRQKETEHFGKNQDQWVRDPESPRGSYPFSSKEYEHNIGHCWEEKLGPNYRYAVCTLNKNFYYLSVFGNRSSLEKGEMLFGNSLAAKPFTLKGTITWWELYDSLEK